MKFRLLALAISLTPTMIFAEIISPEWRIEWNPGIPGGYPDKEFQVDVGSYGAVGDGTTDDSQAFLNAAKAIPATGGALIVPEGVYLIQKKLSFDRGVLIKGEGFDKTRLLFDLDARSENCIEFVKYDRGEWSDALEGFEKGSTEILVNNPERFAAGDYVEIEQINNPDLMYTKTDWIQSWADYAVGQICRIDHLEGGTVILAEPLNFTYRADFSPRIRTLGLIEYPGVEDLYIERLDAGDGHTIQMRYVAYGRIQRIESCNTFRSHIYLSESYHCSVRNNHLHHSHDYGGGGHGYGVDVIRHSVGNLIIDNVFNYLRHSMMTHVGTSGNVFAYNFSTEREPQNLCDISLHGHYSNYNLFESNVVEEIDISDYWGPMGPGNTFLRNVITKEGIDVNDYSHYQNLVGNNVRKGSITIHSSVAKTLKHGNVVRDIPQWDENIDDHKIPTSYFLAEKPDFLDGFAWPLFGPDVADGPILPAQHRWKKGNAITGLDSFADLIPENYSLRAFPNPFNPSTTIAFENPEPADVRIDIFTVSGKLATTIINKHLAAGRYAFPFQPSAVAASGIYLVNLRMNKQTRLLKISYLK